MNDTGNYEVRIDTTGLPFSLFCPASGSYYDTITTTDSIFAHNDFALTCKQGFDLAARSISTPTAFRPANNTIVNILAGDLSNFYDAHCAVGVAGTLTVTIIGAAAYIAPASGALTPSNVTGNVITWNVADFGTVNGMTDILVAKGLLAKGDTYVTTLSVPSNKDLDWFSISGHTRTSKICS